MSKRTRPKSRTEQRALRESRVSGRRPAQKQEAPRPTTTLGKLRRFAPAVAAADVLLAVAAIVLAFVGVMIFSAPLATLPAAIGEVWMLSHLAPFIFDGVTVSVLPVLPTIGVIAVVASRVRAVVRAKVSTVDLAVVFATVVIVPILITLVAWVMLWDAAKVFPLEPPPLWQALLNVLLIHVVAFVLGMGSRLWRALFHRNRLPRSLIDGAKNASRFFQLVCAAALVLIAVLAVVGFSRQQEALNAFPEMDTVAVLGLVLVTLLYLPNAIFAAGSVLVGGDFMLGQASVSLFSIHLVPLPPMPLTALIPGEAHDLAVLLLLVTAAIAVTVWVQARPQAMQVLGATISIGVIVLVANYFASGVLGWYGWVGPTWWISPLLAMIWLGGAGYATVAALSMTRRRQALAAQRQRKAAQQEPEPEPQQEPEFEAEEPAEQEPEGQGGDSVADAESEAEGAAEPEVPADLEDQPVQGPDLPEAQGSPEPEPEPEPDEAGEDGSDGGHRTAPEKAEDPQQESPDQGSKD